MRRSQARLLAIPFFCAVLSVAAQPPGPPPLQPLPELPPPPPGSSAPLEEPGVRIPVPAGSKVEPIRRGGEIVAVRVTPPKGRAYYLVDRTGNGNWMRRDSLDDGLSVPMYPIKEF